MEQGPTSRRQFLDHSIRLLVAVSPLGMLAAGCDQGRKAVQGEIGLKGQHLTIDLSQRAFQALNSVGQGSRLRVPGRKRPLIVTRIGPSEVAAFDDFCSHAGARLGLPRNNVLTCQSGHGGRFDLRGQVVSPPPKSNLTRYPATLTGSTISVDLASPF